MTRITKIAVIGLVLSFVFLVDGFAGKHVSASDHSSDATGLINEDSSITLPEPEKDSSVSIELALNLRKSVREYTGESLTLQEISQIMWAAQGENEQGSRTAPSAGALYPIEVYLVLSSVDGLVSGIYKYQPDSHSLVLIKEGEYGQKLSEASLSQESIAKAPAVIVLAGVAERLTVKYGERGERFMYVEVGHVAQNILLQGVSMELGAVTIGAFNDDAVHQLLLMEASEQPLYVLPIGKLLD